MSPPSRNKPSRAAATRTSGSRRSGGSGPTFSLSRVVLAVALALVGIAWIAVYLNVAAPDGALSVMADLGRWNFLIGLGLVFVALIVSAGSRSPLGHGRGVVVGMLTCFLVGLVWICTYYIAGAQIPFLRDLGQYNLVAGIACMAVGFVFATKWE